MNSKHIVFSLLFLGIGSVCAQKTTKTFKESFKVDKDAVLEINTRYADVEFDTWGKNEILVTTTVTLEGATSQEAEDYFSATPVKISGDKDHVEIKTGKQHDWNFDFDHDFDFQIEIPDIEPIIAELQIPDLAPLAPLPELPPLPPMPIEPFDYEAYKERGEAYVKEWSKAFEKQYDESYKEKLEEWSKRMERKAEAYAARVEERAERMEERAEHMEKRREEREKAMEMREVEREAARRAKEAERALRMAQRQLKNVPNTFFFSSDGENRNFKVKTTIKVKMPKSTKLKMNVRHGEVKISSVTNMDASLQYASLYATNVDGASTKVSAAYSPLQIEFWVEGQLETKFSDKVNLQRVNQLQLNAVSSNVSIGQLNNKAMLTNNLGDLSINEVAANFSDIDITMQNGDLKFNLPKTSFSIRVNAEASKFEKPSSLVLNTTKNSKTTLYKGYHISNSGNKQIFIDAKYSNVALQKL